MEIANVKIKWGKTANKWCVSYDNISGKKKIREQIFYYPEKEKEARDKYLELLDIQVKNVTKL
jgi:hypothetical protein